MIKVRASEGFFVSRECLEESLNQLGLLDYVNIMENQDGIFQLAYEKKVVSTSAGMVSNKLSSDLKKIIDQITPVYVEKLAIKELEKKGFEVKSKKTTENENKIFMERTKPLIEGGSIEKFVLQIQNNRLTLDAINFPGRTCLNVTSPLEKKLGPVIRREFKPESQIKIQQSGRLAQKREIRI